MNTVNTQVIRELQERHEHIVEPTTFRLYGMQWDLLPDVYAPQLTQGAALFIDWLPFPKQGTFCEIGCGTGYISVFANKAGCSKVVATDISNAAVSNTKANAARHDVNIDVRQSDLFENIDQTEKFDLIFWNSSFVDGDDTAIKTEFDQAIFDTGYQAHKQFLTEASQYLNKAGRILLGFSDLGNLAKLTELATEYGLSINILRAGYAETQYRGITFQLLEIYNKNV